MLARGAFFNALAFLASNLRGIFTFLVARLLGSASLGAFGLAWAITDLVSKLSTLGFDTGAIAAVAESEQAGDFAASRRLMRGTLGTALPVSVAIALIGFGVATLSGRSGVASPVLARATAVMLLALPGIVLYRVSNALSRGKGVMHHDVYSRGLTESLGTSVALLGAITLGLRSLAPEIAAIAGTLASGIIAFVVARRLFVAGPATASKPGEIQALLRRSLPIAGYDLLNIGIMKIDLIMLGLFIGRAPGVTLASVGVYAAAMEVAGGLRKVNQTFNPIFAPEVARQLAAGRLDKAQASYGHLARWMLALLLPALAVLALAGGAVMSLFGPTFRSGAGWMVIVSISCAVNAFVGLGETILMVQHPKVNLINSAIALLAGIGVNLVLIPRYGPLGAAIGMLVPYTLQGMLRGIEVSWLLAWRWPWRSLRKPWFAALGALPLALAARAVDDGIATQISAAAIYLASYLLVWRLVGLDPGDRAILSHLFRRDVPATSLAGPSGEGA